MSDGGFVQSPSKYFPKEPIETKYLLLPVQGPKNLLFCWFGKMPEYIRQIKSVKVPATCERHSRFAPDLEAPVDSLAKTHGVQRRRFFSFILLLLCPERRTKTDGAKNSRRSFVFHLLCKAYMPPLKFQTRRRRLMFFEREAFYWQDVRTMCRRPKEAFRHRFVIKIN